MRGRDQPTEAHRDDAALWLAKKVGGSLSVEGLAELETWLNADLRHRKAYDDARVLYARLEEPARHMAVVAPFRSKLAALARPRLGWLLAPAITLVGLAAAWFVNPSAIQNWRADIVTGREIVSAVRLPDGSLARLGADTAIALDFSETRRCVRMLRGEALFEVAHGPAAPFTVLLDDSEVRDLGTKFDIDLVQNEKQARVTVVEGRVAVAGREDTAPVALNRGEQVIVAAGRTSQVQAVDLDLALSWMSGRLVVQSAPLGSVAEALGRQARGRIIVRGGLARRAVSGTFPLNDVDGSLATLAEAMHGTVIHASPFLTILF